MLALWLKSSMILKQQRISIRAVLFIIVSLVSLNCVADEVRPLATAVAWYSNDPKPVDAGGPLLRLRAAQNIDYLGITYDGTTITVATRDAERARQIISAAIA